MLSLRTKFMLTMILLLLSVGGAVWAAHATVEAFQGFKTHQAMISSGDVRLIRSWMTIPYIAHTYRVPDKTLYQALHVQEDRVTRHSTLEAIATRTKHPVSTVIRQVQTTIVSYRKQHTPHPRGPSPTHPELAHIHRQAASDNQESSFQQHTTRIAPAALTINSATTTYNNRMQKGKLLL